MAQATGPWCAHVSYIKPHWPYIVPAPHHAMYGPEHVPDALRADVERDDPHPVYGAFMGNKIAVAFQQEDVRKKVIRAYLGLIKQCDHQLGRILDQLEADGALGDTMIVLISDHGDYLGNHWLGEKDLFHNPSVKIPMIVYDPRTAADATRGTTWNALVEAIDLAPTFVEAAGGDLPDHILEGRSLSPWFHGQTPQWRDVAISEFDYSVTPMRDVVGRTPRDARPLLFDLNTDPDEFIDLAKGDAHGDVSNSYVRAPNYMGAAEVVASDAV